MGERNGLTSIEPGILSIACLICARAPSEFSDLLLIVVTCELFYYYTLLESCFEVYQNLDNLSSANVKNVKKIHKNEGKKTFNLECEKRNEEEATCLLPL